MPTIDAAVSFSLKNVLLATDFSAGSQGALQYARGIAYRQSSDVFAIHVSGPNSYRLLLPEALAITFSQFSENSPDAFNLLKSLIHGLPEVVPVHHQGRIWEVVEDVVERNKIDLLVVASHGRTGLSRVFQGSIAEELFRNVGCPVLIIGPQAKPHASSDLKIKRILLSTDFDPKSAAPFYASWLAREFHAGLTLLNVNDGRFQSVDAGPMRLRSELEQAGLWREPECIVHDGDPVIGILEVAKEVRPDVIVLGAHHPEPARIVTHWPWDIAADVIAEAECPVLTVRERVIC